MESLRAGILSRASTKELSDLRPSLTSPIKQDLAQLAQGNIPKGRLIWGDYGQGKTHALTTIEHLALDLGFAVSRIFLSREVACHHLFNFYGGSHRRFAHRGRRSLVFNQHLLKKLLETCLTVGFKTITATSIPCLPLSLKITFILLVRSRIYFTAT